MESPTRISVVIPAYNSAGTIVRAVQSARAQTYAPAEIVVVDDCSTDNTRQIVESLPGVRLVALPARRGAAGARNAGVAAATGEAIAFLDSDDEWLDRKLELQVALLNSSAHIAFVSCACGLVSPSGADLGDIYRGHPPTTGPDAWKALLEYNFIATPTVLTWRDRILAAGGFDEKLEIAEDQDLWIRLALTGDLAYVPQSLVRVHLRPDSLSARLPGGPLIYTVPMIERHIAALGNRLSKRDVRRIMGTRLGLIGRVAYVRGDFRNGLRLIGRSMMLGYQPLGSLYYLVSASPPATWLKQRLGIGRPW